MVKFCPTCKKIYPLNTKICPVCRNPALMRFCQNCKKMLPQGEIVCPSCGDVDTTQIQNSAEESKKPKKKKKRILPVFVALFLLAGAGIATWWFLFSSVDKVVLVPTSLELKEGETAVIGYTLSPKWAFPKETEWSSTSEKIATVNKNGEVTAEKKGTCSIFYTVDGISGGCKITVKKDGVDFAEVYKAIGGEGYYCKLAFDESYLLIDTNPENLEWYDQSEIKDILWTNKEEDKGIDYVLKVNNELGLPASIATKMGQTRALDGRQTETYEKMEVSWTYHPDNGLEVLYTIR